MTFNQFNGTFDEKCSELNDFIKNSNNIVFFGGAGVSTESGIPDFRSSDGIYSKKTQYKDSPEQILSKNYFNHNPKIFYQYYKESFDLRSYSPNITHEKLSQMEQLGKLKGIITQNVDGLHQKAGSRNVCEVHGTIYKNHCIKCGKIFDVNYIFDDENSIPRCDCEQSNCFVRPNIVLYGENLPTEKWNNAVSLIEKANMLIVAGTSLTVNPAAILVSMFSGKYLVIINKQETQYDRYTNIFFRENMSEVFKNIKF